LPLVGANGPAAVLGAFMALANIALIVAVAVIHVCLALAPSFIARTLSHISSARTDSAQSSYSLPVSSILPRFIFVGFALRSRNKTHSFLAASQAFVTRLDECFAVR